MKNQSLPTIETIAAEITIPASTAREPSVRVKSDPALLVFGLTENGVPQAAWFTSHECEAAERASGTLTLVALRVTSEDEQALARMLPRGRVAADGEVQVPLLSPDLFQVLQVLVLGIRLARVRPASVTGATPPQEAASTLLAG